MAFLKNRVKMILSRRQRRNDPVSKATLLDSRIKQYAYRETAQIYRDIGASPDGLSTDQVEIMREKYGTNSFAGRRDDTLLRRLRRAHC